MSPFLKENAQLASLRSFDPSAFAADGKVSQNICNFVLALALIYNDLKDALYAYSLLENSKPAGEFQRRPDWGAYVGIKIHLIRHHIGLVHAICELIRKNQSILDDPLFRAVFMQMTRRARESWQALAGAALGQLAKGSLAESLARIRHKVSFHYDTEEIYSGYRKHFFDESGTVKEQAAVSIGGGMSESRFYFADAAAQGYLEIRLTGEEAKSLFEEVIGTMEDMSVAVLDLVHKFIQRRGFPYRVD